jgi:hypothetical protein
MTAPANHGRRWTHDEDKRIAEAPEHNNEHLALALGRSVHAVECRRAILAARLHTSSGSAVEECAELFGVGVEKVKGVLEAKENERVEGGAVKRNESQVKREKKKTVHMSKNIENHRQAQQTMTSFTSRPAVQTPPTSILRRPQQPNHNSVATISTICGAIKASGGTQTGMRELWTQDTLVPTLVQYYAGFQAYAEFVRFDNPRAT